MSKELVPSFEGDLPQGWEIVTLGEIISPEGIFIDGDWVESKDQDPNGNVRLIQLADVADGFYKDKSARFLTKESALNLNCTFLKKGDVLIARMPDPLGRACIFPGDEKECVTVVDVCVVRSGTEEISNRWIMYWVNSPRFRNTISSLQSGTTRRRISRGNLATITFPFPPPEQQKRIVAKIEELFSHIDAGIEALKKAKQLLKQYRQSVLKAAVTGELTKEWREANKDKLEPATQLLKRIQKKHRQKWEEQQLEQLKIKGKIPKDDKWKEKHKIIEVSIDKHELPNGWLLIPLDYVADVISGFAFKSKEFIDAGVPAVKIANVSYGDFIWKQQQYLPVEFLEKYKGFVISPKDILLALTRPITNNNVKACLYPDDEVPALLNQRVCTIRNGKSLLKQYLLQVLQSEPFKQQIKNGMSETLLPNLSPNDLKKFKFGISSMEEQKEIARIVDEKLDIANRVFSELELQDTKAEKNKQAILASAFSGELVEPAETDGTAKELLDKIYEKNVIGQAKQKITKRKPVKKRVKSVSKRKIIDVLKDSADFMTVDQLFDATGYGEDPDEIENLYLELKHAVDNDAVSVETNFSADKKQENTFIYVDQS